MKPLYKFLKYLLVAFLVIVLAGSAITYFIFHQTPNFMRNNSANGITLEVKVSDDDRLPIIRTFLKEDYEKLSNDEKAKLKRKSYGRIEGDIPAVSYKENPSILLSFTKNKTPVEVEKGAQLIITPTRQYLDKETKERKVSLDLGEKTAEGYPIKLKRYNPLFERYQLDFYFVEVHYQIEGKDYISLFGIHYSTADEGTDFFKNETLENPLPPEA